MSTMQDPRVPARLIVGFALFPVVPLVVFLLADVFGHSWNVHGDAIAVFAATLGSALIGALAEAILVPLAVTRMFRYPRLVSASNIAATLVGFLFLVAVAIAAALSYLR